ncbi:MAG: tRNA pseudouridine(38-40) synthase TruA [Cyanobacteria bacterium REEB65]|nr:tRNA pseudouridine(38-40) synthase TruA [Cyanobacteria bacterium REEB65]
MDRQAIALLVAYDGTEFAGFQRQASDRTVQGELEAAIFRLSGESPDEMRLQAAGRTDAGVHATGQVVAFRTRRDWSAGKWQAALNGVLPADIAVRGAREASMDFSPRRDALSRSYVYQVLVQETPCPLRRRTHYRVPALLQEEPMVAAWQSVVGKHDFAAFRSTGSTDRDTVVTVTEATVTRSGNERLFAICAVSFLYHMVRRLVGAVLAVGRGVLSLADFQRFLAATATASLRPAPTAPSHGLVLQAISYPPPWSWATGS